MDGKNVVKSGSRKRYTISLDESRAVILEAAKLDGGSTSDAACRLIDLAARADLIDRQNRELAEAMVVAMKEMAATLAEIRSAVTRLEKGDA